MHFKRAYVIKFMVSITLMVDYYIYERSTDFILFVYSLRAPLQKMLAPVTRDGTICAKNSTFAYFDGSNSIAEKDT